MSTFTITLNTPVWNIESETGYKPVTTFWSDFSIADKFGISAVKDTFQRAMNEWKNNAKYLTELVLVLNHKGWQHYNSNKNMASVYFSLYEEADRYATQNLKEEELDYYYQTTD